jgi:hypothetical protein
VLFLALEQLVTSGLPLRPAQDGELDAVPGFLDLEGGPEALLGAQPCMEGVVEPRPWRRARR